MMRHAYCNWVTRMIFKMLPLCSSVGFNMPSSAVASQLIRQEEADQEEAEWLANLSHMVFLMPSKQRLYSEGMLKALLVHSQQTHQFSVPISHSHTSSHYFVRPLGGGSAARVWVVGVTLKREEGGVVLTCHCLSKREGEHPPPFYPECTAEQQLTSGPIMTPLFSNRIRQTDDSTRITQNGVSDYSPSPSAY